MGLCNLALDIVDPLSFSQININHAGGLNAIDDMFLYASLWLWLVKRIVSETIVSLELSA